MDRNKLAKLYLIFLLILATLGISCSNNEKKDIPKANPIPPIKQDEVKALTAQEEKNIMDIWAKRSNMYNFNMLVEEGSKGKGQLKLQIEHPDDQTWIVKTQVSIRAKALFIVVYRYDQEATEVWKGTNLHSLTSSTDDNGKKFSVKLESQGTFLVGTINQKEAKLERPKMLCTLWNVAEIYSHIDKIKQIPMIDAQEAKITYFPVKLIGDETIKIGDKDIPCKHVKLEGSDWELWMDSLGIVVKQFDIQQKNKVVTILTDEK